MTEPAPRIKNGKLPPRRLTNIARRPREYLRADELEKLIAAAKARGLKFVTAALRS
jgi:hypothetical protein